MPLSTLFYVVTGSDEAWIKLNVVECLVVGRSSSSNSQTWKHNHHRASSCIRAVLFNFYIVSLSLASLLTYTLATVAINNVMSLLLRTSV